MNVSPLFSDFGDGEINKLISHLRPLLLQWMWSWSLINGQISRLNCTQQDSAKVLVKGTIQIWCYLLITKVAFENNCLHVHNVVWPCYRNLWEDLAYCEQNAPPLVSWRPWSLFCSPRHPCNYSWLRKRVQCDESGKEWLTAHLWVCAQTWNKQNWGYLRFRRTNEFRECWRNVMR